MERPIRSIAKALTWQVLGLTSMTGITYLLTGSLLTGGAVALAGAASGAALYIVHERAWARIRWGIAEAQRLAGGADGEGRAPSR
jgi:uncharacterized membrane protein